MTALERWIKAMGDWVTDSTTQTREISSDLYVMSAALLDAQKRIRVLEARLDALEVDEDGGYVN